MKTDRKKSIGFEHIWRYESSFAGKLEVENIIILFPWSETNALWPVKQACLVLAELNCNRLFLMLISYNIYQTAKDWDRK